MRTRTVILGLTSAISLCADQVRAGDLPADCERTHDLAFLHPDSLDWFVDVRDGAVCNDVGSFSVSSAPQLGLPSDPAFHAGEPISVFRDGYDELIVVRPAAPAQADYPNALVWSTPEAARS